MKGLHELISARIQQISDLWVEKLRGSIHPESTPHPELLDHMPTFLAETAAALQKRISPESSSVAAEHGEHRLRLGFSLDAVVREYGVLREAILEFARREDVSIAPEDYDILFKILITGIAEAVTEYARQRDAEVQRQSTEHFAFIAHEIRNPLSSAMLAFEVLRMRGALSTSDRTVGVLQRGLSQVQDLVEHSLRAARVGSGIDLRRTRVELAAVLEEAADNVALDAEFKAIQIQVEVERGIEVEVDVRLLSSAVSNLVGNAVKFTHEGGSVYLRGSLRSGAIVVEVEDRCGGLEPGVAEAAFKPFVQVGADRSGFGLGLAIAKQAVDAHGGTMRVQNLPGVGCIFFLELPHRA